ncbi:MAG TPA: sigma-70 family RNA polymerase sigma factor [Blastocatellia bacterium]|nr:sigma-70 family RNA polymerase sigma factor [Blastocatellia bacterium]
MNKMAEYAESEVVVSAQVQDPESTDDELIARTRAGDEVAFARLFDRHRQLVARFGYRFFTRREQVEEIVQESFIKAYFALANYQGGHENSFVAWLARITMNTCYDELRRQQRRSESSIGELTDEETSYLSERMHDLSANGNIEGLAISRDLANKLLSRLKPEDRLVLTLLKLEELSISEIAGLTGWTAAKVKMRSHRAQHGLRQLLTKFL